MNHKERTESHHREPVCPGLNFGHLLQISIDGIGIIKSSLIGMENNKYFIVKLPNMPEITGKLFKKNQMSVHYFHAGKVYSFRSTLIGLLKEPFRLYIIEYPESIEIINLRKKERSICRVPAELRDIYSELKLEIFDGYVADISSSGCSFERSISEGITFPEFNVGQSITLSLFISGNGDDQMVIQCEIRNIKKDKDKMKLGLKFKLGQNDSEDQSIMKSINSFIVSLDS